MVPSQLQSCLVPCLVLLGWEEPEIVGLRTLVLCVPEMHSWRQSLSEPRTWGHMEYKWFFTRSWGSSQHYYPWKVGFECLEKAYSSDSLQWALVSMPKLSMTLREITHRPTDGYPYIQNRNGGWDCGPSQPVVAEPASHSPSLESHTHPMVWGTHTHTHAYTPTSSLLGLPGACSPTVQEQLADAPSASRIFPSSMAPEHSLPWPL